MKPEQGKDSLPVDPLREIYDDLELNEKLLVFLEPNFDRNRIIEDSVIDSGKVMLELLNSNIRRIEDVTNSYVSSYYEQLLEQIDDFGGIKNQVQHVEKDIIQLNSMIDPIVSDLSKKSESLDNAIKQLKRLQDLSDALALIHKFYHSRKRLQRFSSLFDQINSDERCSNAEAIWSQEDLISSSQTVHEIELLVHQDDNFLLELDFLRPEIDGTKKYHAYLHQYADEKMKEGLNSLNQIPIGQAVLMYYHLGILQTGISRTVTQVIQSIEGVVEHCIKNINPSTKSTAVLSNTDNKTGSIDSIFKKIYVAALKIWDVQRVLAKLKEPMGKNYLLVLVLESENLSLFDNFWEGMTALMQAQFQRAMEKEGTSDVIVSQYPRIRRESRRVVRMIEKSTIQKAELDNGTSKVQAESTGSFAVENALKGLGSSKIVFSQLMSSFSPVLVAFKSKSLGRLTDQIQLMFPHNTGYHMSPPSKTDIATLLTTIDHEIEYAANDKILIKHVVEGIIKAVKILCNSIETLVNTGKQSLQIIAPYSRTAAQAHNVALLCLLQQVNQHLNELPKKIRTNAEKSPLSPSDPIQEAKLENDELYLQDLLSPSVKGVEELAYEIVGKYLQSIATALESILSRMHEDSFSDKEFSSNDNMSTNPSGSKFMLQFSAAFKTILSDHISKLPESNFIHRCRNDLISRIISSFVRHASIIRPLEENGKLKIANDMAQLELLLEQICSLKSIGSPYKELRAFRQMIFLETEAISRDSLLDNLRPSNVWHHLVSRSPVELQNPHERSNWTPEKYVIWMNTVAGNDDETSRSLSLRQCPLGNPGLISKSWALAAERCIWKEISTSLDVYIQRISASIETPTSPLYRILLELGPNLLAGYEAQIVHSERK